LKTRIKVVLEVKSYAPVIGQVGPNKMCKLAPLRENSSELKNINKFLTHFISSLVITHHLLSHSVQLQPSIPKGQKSNFWVITNFRRFTTLYSVSCEEGRIFLMLGFVFMNGIVVEFD